MHAFFGLTLGKMTMEEYGHKFTELLKCVEFIKDGKFKLQRYVSGLPPLYGDKIKYDKPNTYNEAMRKVETSINKEKMSHIRKLLRMKRKEEIWNKGRRGSNPHLQKVILMKTNE